MVLPQEGQTGGTDSLTSVCMCIRIHCFNDESRHCFCMYFPPVVHKFGSLELSVAEFRGCFVYFAIRAGSRLRLPHGGKSNGFLRASEQLWRHDCSRCVKTASMKKPAEPKELFCSFFCRAD